MTGNRRPRQDEPESRALLFAAWLEGAAARSPTVTISSKFAYALAALLVQLHAERSAAA